MAQGVFIPLLEHARENRAGVRNARHEGREVSAELDAMTNADFICALAEAAHPSEQPSAEHADLMDESARRIRKLESQVKAWESAADMAGGADTPDRLIDYIIAASL